MERYKWTTNVNPNSNVVLFVEIKAGPWGSEAS